MLASIQKEKESISNEYVLVSSAQAVWEYSNSYEDRLQKFIRQEIAKIIEVEYIYCRREEPVYFVWVLIKEFDPAVRRKIYQKQKEIIAMFPDEVFDFYVIARLNKPAHLIINQSGVELIYQRPNR